MALLTGKVLGFERFARKIVPAPSQTPPARLQGQGDIVNSTRCGPNGCFCRKRPSGILCANDRV